MTASHQAALLVPPAAGLGFQLLQTSLEELGKVRTKRTRHRAGVSPGRPSKPAQARAPAPVPAFFFSLWGLTQGLQLKLVFVCCSLSRAQQCSLQWLAAALFPAPQGSDIYCFTKSF